MFASHTARRILVKRKDPIYYYQNTTTTMKLVCLLLVSVAAASVSAFGVVLLPRQHQLRPAVCTQGTTSFVPKVVLYDKENDDNEEEEDPLLDDVVEDDEWMKLTIQLTDALFGEVKRVVDRVVDEEDKEKIKKAGREIEVFVKVRCSFVLPFRSLRSVEHFFGLRIISLSVYPRRA